MGVFVLDIVIHIFGYCLLYVKDYWNIVDFIIIMLSLAFIFLVINIDDVQTQQVFNNIKGVFRLLRIFLLFRKLTQLKEKRDIQKRKKINKGFDLRSPLERVLEILNNLRDTIDVDESKIIKDLNYCIKCIGNNTLYEANMEYDGSDGKERNEVQMIMGAYSKQVVEKDDRSRRPSVSGTPSVQPTDIDSARKYIVSTDKIEDMLKINLDGREELHRVDTYEFNVFKIQELTLSNELVAVTSYILAKENIFATKKIPVSTFINFMDRLQRGYKDVTYHNQTHAADLSQVNSNF